LSDRFDLEADFADRYGPWALIAGGSEGTGETFARRLAAQGINLLLVARRVGPLHDLATSIRTGTGVEVRTLTSDLASSTAVSEIASAAEGLDVGLVIFNAGATTEFGRFLDSDPAYLASMTWMNCHTTSQLAHHFGQQMRARGHGGMAFLGSMAGFAGSSYQTIYNATKAFVWVLAEGLWHDLGGDGIDVVALVLGATTTPSHERLQADFSQQTTMTPDEVAEEGLANLGSGPLHVVGEHNRAVVPYILGRDRSQIVSLMSQSSAAIAGIDHHEVSPRTAKN
jgi:short-subunit dehydrogenase